MAGQVRRFGCCVRFEQRARPLGGGLWWFVGGLAFTLVFLSRVCVDSISGVWLGRLPRERSRGPVCRVLTLRVFLASRSGPCGLGPGARGVIVFLQSGRLVAYYSVVGVGRHKAQPFRVRSVRSSGRCSLVTLPIHGVSGVPNAVLFTWSGIHTVELGSVAWAFACYSASFSSFALCLLVVP